MSAKPPSILHVDLSMGFGGAERYCVDLAERQQAQGHRVGIVGWKNSAILERIPIGVASYVAPRLFPGRAVARAARAHRADILHTHLPVSSRAARSAIAPMVTTLHLRYRQQEMRGVDGLICIAEWQEQEAAGYHGLKITAYNWPPTLAPATQEEVAGARRALDAGPQTFVIGFLARLHPVKRADLLIDAFRQAAPANAILVLVGDGPERKALEARARGNGAIRFLGHRDDMAVWHRAIDLFVLPSDWEGLPLGVLEAMTLGTPILATASQGTAEALRGSRATLVPVGDAAALEAAMARLAAQFAAGALPRAPYDMARFDAATALDRIENFYRQVIAGRRLPP